MTSTGRLLGLQLPPVPSHLSDFMPSCVRSAQKSDAKECSSITPVPDLPLQGPHVVSASNPLCTKLCPSDNRNADMNSLERLQATKNPSSFTLSCTDDVIEVIKPTEEKDKTAVESPSASGWGVPYFKRGGNSEVDSKASTTKTSPESHPTTPPEEDGAVTVSKETGENSHSHCRGLRSKLSSMLSLEKRTSLTGLPLVTGHSSQYVMEMSGFQSTSFNRRTQGVESKISSAIQKESFARMFDLYDERNFSSHPGYGATGGYKLGRATDAAVDAGVKTNPPWIDKDKVNDAWGTEPWHSDQRNILMKTLHIMRCDIESLKMMLRSIDLPAARGRPHDAHQFDTLAHAQCHPVMMRSSVAMSETQETSCKPLDDVQVQNRIEPVVEDKTSAQAAEKVASSKAGKDLCVSELNPPEKGESDEPLSTWSGGCPKKRKQWWRELLAAFGLTVWVLTGAVLVAKAIGVPNLGVSNNLAYSGCWGRSDDEERAKTPGYSTPIKILRSHVKAIQSLDSYIKSQSVSV
uniref:Uncharacterized protein n=1 Tax=Physcomitrium patens TaxID=3218 RepID=A0A2K1IN12_PHYPA|nr:hypothetical protein PHYPA_026981 [Physcomitrium patens]